MLKAVDANADLTGPLPASWSSLIHLQLLCALLPCRRCPDAVTLLLISHTLHCCLPVMACVLPLVMLCMLRSSVLT